MWLDSDKNWDSCALQVHRKHELQHKSRSGYESVQGKVLKEKYTTPKAERLIAIRKDSGMWYPDPDFPEDDDEPRKFFQ